MSRPRPIIVSKFGGAALDGTAAIEGAASIVKRQLEDGHAVVVVASAMAGVTDTLLQVAEVALAGDETSALRLVRDLEQRHLGPANALAPGDAELMSAIEESFAELRRLTGGIAALRELTATTRDTIVARGERLSAGLLHATLRRSGIDARLVDGTQVIHARGSAGNASPAEEPTTDAVRRVLRPLIAAEIVPVIPGYIGVSVRPRDSVDADQRAQVVTLGRGGSDLSATSIGRAIGAAEIVLWKDVPGILTADPRAVPEARVVPHLEPREASELAYHGAKVLHPRALIPLTAWGRTTGNRRATVPLLRIRPFGNPMADGTLILTPADHRHSRRGNAQFPVKAISSLPSQALLTVRGNGMAGVPGVAARAFTAMERVGISVALISQASSEQSICIGIPAASGESAARTLTAAFAPEIERGEIEGIELRTGVATIAVVGAGMAGSRGIAARVFSALAQAGINIVAIAQGSSELNISLVVDAADAVRAQQAAHAEFRLDRIGGGAAQLSRRADLLLLGLGRVGRELARQLARAQADVAKSKSEFPVRVVAVIDSRGWVFDNRGLTPRRLLALIRAKEEGRQLSELTDGHRGSSLEAVASITAHALTRPILVDLTAGDTSEVLAAALRDGVDLVLANKKPLAEPTVPGGVLGTAAARGRRVRHEATVGAGLPIMDTIRKLAESGDEVLRIESSPSGTLSFLFSELAKGRRFSDVLRDAMARGYTEPDPREDLSGQDVARKGVILARLLGWQGTLQDVAIESLVPPALAAVPVAEFLERLEALDTHWAERLEAVAARGRMLRYRAEVTPRSVRVGVVEVDGTSPFAALRDTDNQFVFTTKRYRERPLVITGPGAGPGVTAAGVLNDVLALAASR